MKTTLGAQEITAIPNFSPHDPLLSDEDLKRFHAGQHQRIYDHLGCHLRELKGISGALFAVWAPHARQVSVIGSFNGWDHRRHPMRLRKEWGVWELFIPHAKEGERYQYVIETASGQLITKTDPYGFACDLRLNKEMSIVTNIDRFTWEDQEWLTQRAENDPLQRPISTYEVHLGSWMRMPEAEDRFLSYRELAEKLIPYVKEMGFTYIELLPVAEHPFYPSWGYQVTGYYAPTSRYGSPEDFMYFINECHKQDIGVIVDWVPAHFPKDEFSLGNFDGTELYEHADPWMAEHKDWGTFIFDYGKPEVKNFLIANTLFWFENYHIDGIRVDAVASMLYLDYSRQEGEWEPNEYGGRENLEAITFLKELNRIIHDRFSGVMTIAEESTSWLGVTYPAYLGGLDFTFKWNLGWMNDVLYFLSHDPLHRKFVHMMVPFALLYAFHEHFMLELSHDEVVHGKRSLLNKMPGDEWQKFANLRALYGFMFGHPGKKLLFMGDEFGQPDEWNHDKSLDWHLLQHEPHQGLQHYVRDLNHLYTSEPALYADELRERGFAWIDYHDFQNSVIAFMRKIPGEENCFLIVLCNFMPVLQENYRVGVPLQGHYEEVLNSDKAEYGGQDIGNPKGCLAEQTPWQHQPYSIALTLPPLSTIILKPAEKKDIQKSAIPAETTELATPSEKEEQESRMAREQGSKTAILSESGEVTREKISSG